MAVTDPQIKNLLTCINLEEQEQVQRYSLDQQHSLRSLKAAGLALHPITVTRKNFGYADYPEISFKLNYPVELNLFKEFSADITMPAGEKLGFRGLLMVDEQALLGLDDNNALELYRKGFLAWIYAHLYSLSNLRALAQLISKAGESSEEETTTEE